jgi:hypothetical protein
VLVRAARLALATLIGVVAVPFATSPAFAAVNMRLSTNHGPASASFDVSVSYPISGPPWSRSCKGPVTFYWDTANVGTVGPSERGDTCTAGGTMSPRSSAPGQYTVKAELPNGDSATATYTVDAAPVPPKPTPPPPPTTGAPAAGSPQATKSAQPSRSAQPSQSARPTPSAGSRSASAAAAADTPGTAAPADQAGPATMDTAGAAAARPAGTPLVVWLAGGVLILLGAVLLGNVIRQRRRAAAAANSSPAVGRAAVTHITFQ